MKLGESASEFTKVYRKLLQRKAAFIKLEESERPVNKFKRDSFDLSIERTPFTLPDL